MANHVLISQPGEQQRTFFGAFLSFVLKACLAIATTVAACARVAQHSMTNAREGRESPRACCMHGMLTRTMLPGTRRTATRRMRTCASKGVKADVDAQRPTANSRSGLVLVVLCLGAVLLLLLLPCLYTAGRCILSTQVGRYLPKLRVVGHVGLRRRPAAPSGTTGVQLPWTCACARASSPRSCR